jgi:hypothetical protein
MGEYLHILSTTPQPRGGTCTPHRGYTKSQRPDKGGDPTHPHTLDPAVLTGGMGLHRRLGYQRAPETRRNRGAAVHILTRTIIHIDASGCEETRTVMRTELVAIHTALTKFEDHLWLSVFTYSFSTLQALCLHYYRPGLTIAPHYHPHMLLLQSISHLLESRREKSYSTSLRKVRAHTHIRGNDLADAAAKIAVTDYDTLPSEQTTRVDIGAIVPRPPFWVMYTVNHHTPSPALAAGPRQATIRPPWWTIPEAVRLQIYAFMRPSHQLR